MTDTPQHLAPRPARPRWRRRVLPAGLVAALVAVLAVSAVIVADDGPGEDVVASGTPTPTIVRPTTTPPSTSRTTSTIAAPTTTRPTAALAPPTTAAVPASSPATSPARPAPTAGAALCIGDSVMLGASPQYLNTLSMCGTVDAEQSRQFSGAPAAVAAHAPYPAAVVVHLGNNGTVDRDDVDAAMAHLAGVPRVVFVTVQLSGTRPWEGQANGEIRATAERYPNVVVADWKAASDGHPDFTRSDGIHMSPAGAGAYAATIAAAL
jgi:hypothetical protein